jgi:hypothetical protein
MFFLTYFSSYSDKILHYYVNISFDSKMINFCFLCLIPTLFFCRFVYQEMNFDQGNQKQIFSLLAQLAQASEGEGKSIILKVKASCSQVKARYLAKRSQSERKREQVINSKAISELQRATGKSQREDLLSVNILAKR